MGIDLGNGYQDLLSHVGHDIECVAYGDDPHDPHNVAVQCKTCGEILLDFDHPDILPE